MDEVILHTQAKRVILEDAVDTYPHECCGFLYGFEDDKRVITLAVPAANQREENRERRFEISPQEYMKAEQFAEDNKLVLLGIYHSHPEHAAIPSDYDLKRALPWFSYIIVSVKNRKVASLLSWKLNNNGRFEEELVTSKEENFDPEYYLSTLNSDN
jgi:proteasome lid subunit RPN8/RPN11